MSVLFERMKDLIGFPNYVAGEGIEEVLEKQKNRLVVYTLAVMLTCISVLICVRLIIGEQSGHPATAWTVPFFCGLLLVIAKKFKNTKANIIALNVFLLLIIPFRTYLTGGLHSVVIFWYLAHAVLAYSLLGKRWGYVFLVYGLLSIVGFYFVDLPLPNVLYTKLSGFYKLFTIYTILLPLLFLIKEKDYFAKALKKEEQRQASFVILRRLTHEVGNAMNIAAGYIEILQEDKDKACAKVVDSALERVETLMEDMEVVASRTDITALLAKYEKDPSIREALNEVKRM